VHTYPTYCNPGLQVVGFETRELFIKWDVGFVHRNHLKGRWIEENERVVQMCQSLGVDLLRCDLITQSLASVSALVVADSST
jgi:hypothetical protein